MKSTTKIAISAAVFFLLAAATWISIARPWNPRQQVTTQASVSSHELESGIRKVFENRCAVCHSCYNAPCQLNLTSYEGLLRGATKSPVYNSKRLKAVPPTRLYTDAKDVEGWRNKGFHQVLHTGHSDDPKNLSESILLDLVNLRQANGGEPSVPSESDMCADGKIGTKEKPCLTCAATISEHRDLMAKRPDVGMPYGLPALTTNEIALVTEWIKMGAPGPEDETDVRKYLNGSKLQSIRDWENFFNSPDDKSRLVSRYIFDHLFLAHISIAEIRGEFFRLVRSRTECTQGVDEIATLRPFDSPGTETFYYCMRRLPGTPTEKNHIVYRLDDKKMNRFKELFFQPDWKVSQLPSFDAPTRANPFITYRDIPGKMRYLFLLDDAQYHVMTFIKGPVCRGNTAVNSIQEQFLVLFLDPKSDPYSTSDEFEKNVAQITAMPAEIGSDISVTSLTGLRNLWNLGVVKKSNRYRAYRDEFIGRAKPLGYGLDDIWDGDEHNNNALLTVLRRHDSSVVVKGVVGDVPKTAFVLDYVLFERLSYYLVSGFDVYGDLGHQLLTRIYMSYIRMEAENLFLSFLPPQSRKALRKEWYQGTFLTDLKMSKMYPNYGESRAQQMTYSSPERAKAEFFEQVFSKKLNAKVRGRIDPINWSLSSPPPDRDARLEPIESEFRKLVSRTPKSGAQFVQYMPDLAFIRVKLSGDGSRDLVYSLVRQKDHTNIAWINLEDARREKNGDSIYIARGFIGSFPNRFLVVDASEVPEFVAQLNAVKDEKMAQSFYAKYAILRSNPNFWSFADWFNRKSLALNPVEGGLYDLNRYETATAEKN